MRAGFPHSEILGSAPICRLPEAYRRLSRPSSPVIAKASTTCTYSLDPITLPPVARRAFAIRASLFSACAHHRPFELRQCTMQYITQCVLAHGRSRKQPDAPPTHHLHLSRIFKDQPTFLSVPVGGYPRRDGNRRTLVLQPPSLASEEARREASVALASLLPSLVAPAAARQDLVEPTGIEPVTSCLQSRRSPS